MTGIPSSSFFEKLTNAIHLDYVLKIVGVGGFVITFLASWHSLAFSLKVCMLASVAAWLAGARFSKIYQ